MRWVVKLALIDNGACYKRGSSGLLCPDVSVRLLSLEKLESRWVHRPECANLTDYSTARGDQEH